MAIVVHHRKISTREADRLADLEATADAEELRQTVARAREALEDAHGALATKRTV